MGKSIKGTRTEKNLGISFAGESQARMRYTYFASAAKKDLPTLLTKKVFLLLQKCIVKLPLPKKDTKKDTVRWRRTSKKARCLRKIPKWYGNAAIADTCL